MYRTMVAVVALLLAGLVAAVAAAWQPPTDVRAMWSAPGQAIVSWTQHSDADRVCLSVYQPDWYGDTWQMCVPSAAGERQAAVVAEMGAHLFIEEWNRAGRVPIRYGEAGPFDLGSASGAPSPTPPPTATATPTATPVFAPPTWAPTPRPPTATATPRPTLWPLYLPIVRR